MNKYQASTQYNGASRRPGQGSSIVFINNNIRTPNIKIIDDGFGTDLGVMPNYKAQLLAKNANLDLVQVTFIQSQALSICKICDYGKYQYLQKQKIKDQQKRNKASIQDIKRLTFTIRIEDADLETKLKHIKEFIAKNCKVRIIIKFTRREVYTSLAMGRTLMNKIIGAVSDVSEVEQFPKQENTLMFCSLKPKSKRDV